VNTIRLLECKNLTFTSSYEIAEFQALGGSFGEGPVQLLVPALRGTYEVGDLARMTLEKLPQPRATP
jgi:hypothetical protein